MIEKNLIFEEKNYVMSREAKKIVCCWGWISIKGAPCPQVERGETGASMIKWQGNPLEYQVKTIGLCSLEQRMQELDAVW
jgi:hypothetical protein